MYRKNYKKSTRTTYKRIYLKNVPFSIKPTNPSKDKYIGDFKIINDLLNSNDVNFGLPNTISTSRIGSVTDDTSLIMNDLYVCPPPKSSGSSGS